MSVAFQRVLADIDKDAENDKIMTNCLDQVKDQARNLGIPYPIYVMSRIHSLRIAKRAKEWLRDKQAYYYL